MSKFVVLPSFVKSMWELSFPAFVLTFHHLIPLFRLSDGDGVGRKACQVLTAEPTGLFTRCGCVMLRVPPSAPFANFPET